MTPLFETWRNSITPLKTCSPCGDLQRRKIIGNLIRAAILFIIQFHLMVFYKTVIKGRHMHICWRCFCRINKLFFKDKTNIWYVISLLFYLRAPTACKEKISQIFDSKIMRNTQCLMSTTYISSFITFLFHFPASMKLHSIYTFAFIKSTPLV